jgi:hypothetical protein
VRFRIVASMSYEASQASIRSREKWFKLSECGVSSLEAPWGGGV